MQLVGPPVKPVVLFRIRQVEHVFFLENDFTDDDVFILEPLRVEGSRLLVLGQGDSARQGKHDSDS